mmetsp:Transcript_81855/g.144842  ORF Transcript_81855/g.144842 Transcript_81855/m.144842 type:complete len:203 (-) Transcript_81855:131-739(-)
MRRALHVLACLAVAGHGERLRSAQEPSEAFARLLLAREESGVAFNPSVHVARGGQAIPRRRCQGLQLCEHAGKATQEHLPEQIEDLESRWRKPESEVPKIEVGDAVRVTKKFGEALGKGAQTKAFEGIVIATRHGRNWNGTITVQQNPRGQSVEQVFRIHSPNVVKIEVLKSAQARRKKLYKLRGLPGKSARLRQLFLTDSF